MPKTKIICTIGPASQDAEVMRQMIEAGTDIVRLNFPTRITNFTAHVLKD